MFSDLVYAVDRASSIYYYYVDREVKSEKKEERFPDCITSLLLFANLLKNIKQASSILKEVESWIKTLENTYDVGTKLNSKDHKSLEKSASNWIIALKKISLEVEKEQKSFQSIEERIDSLEDNISPVGKNIEAYISAVQNASLSFVECSPTERSLEPRLRGLLNNSCFPGEEIMCTGYFDQYLLKQFKALNPRPNIKFICPDLTNSKSDNVNMDALKRLKKMGAEVRFHPMLHARVVLNSKEVIVGSSDLKSDCLGGRRFDAGVWSNNPVLIRAVNEFFQKVWVESRPLS